MLHRPLVHLLGSVLGATFLASTASASYVTVTDEHVDVISVTYSAQDGLRGRVQTETEVFAAGDVLVYDGPSGTTSFNRPAGSPWDFLGVAAGQPVFVWPQSGQDARIEAGLEAGSVPPGAFASYRPDDPRVSTTARWLRVELVGLRFFDLAGNANTADFSLWQASGPTPLVWMSTVNGIDSTDAFFLTEGGHVHANWGFTRAGYYQIDFRLTGVLASNGQSVSSPVTTWHFGVEHQPIAIPEPGPMALLVLGGAMASLIKRRSRRLGRRLLGMSRHSAP